MTPTWTELEAAQALLLAHTPAPTATESVALEEALHRVCACDVRAVLPAPPFCRSPLDGFALHSEDSAGAGPGAPVALPVLRCLFAGDAAGPALPRGSAVRIMTGAALPEGADCVVRQEDTVYEGGRLLLHAPLAHEENMVFQGEDLPAGQLLCREGEALTPTLLGLLAGQGLPRVAVRPLPVVAVASTGSELAPLGQPLPEGKIYDSNGLLLAGRVRELGGRAARHAALPDQPEALHAWLDEALQSAALTVTTGGVSVGERDFLPRVAAELGGEVLFQGIALKPGGPALALCRQGHILLCLSGNPFAALATFEVLAAPVLKKLAGCRAPLPKKLRATAQNGYAKHSPGRRLVRARLRGGEVEIPPLGHASGMLHSFSGCDCFVDMPAGSPGIEAGQAVEVILPL